MSDRPSTRARARLLRTLAASFALLAVLTGVMLAFRSRLDKAHVALLYLLVVLGASSVGSRAVGLLVGGAAFLLFNFLFLLPYYTLRVADPLDWLVLFVFLATSVVAAELLDGQRKQAALAERRSEELDQLATLGAETLNAARAEQALAAIAGVICRTVGVERCELFVRETATNGVDRSLRLVADSLGGVSAAANAAEPGGLLRYIVETGRAAIAREDGTLHVVAPSSGDRAAEPVAMMRAFAIPLTARGEIVGVLRLSATTTFALTTEQSRVLTALAYYAALGIERSRLESAADWAEAFRRADRMKDALLAAVSHDLRTPLTTIKAVAHEITQGAGRDRAGIIEEEADRLASLVEGLLELSQLNAGALAVRAEVNTVDDLIGAALQRAQAVLHGHEVEVDLGDELLVGQFDFSHALRVVVNLLENAAKYSPRGTPILVAARRHGDVLEIEVSDRGVGVPTSDRERIFEPFYRAAGATPDVRGAGLGLSIARGLARAQGGDVRMLPRDSGGSTFVIALPAGELPTV